MSFSIFSHLYQHRNAKASNTGLEKQTGVEVKHRCGWPLKTSKEAKPLFLMACFICEDEVNHIPHIPISWRKRNVQISCLQLKLWYPFLIAVLSPNLFPVSAVLLVLIINAGKTESFSRCKIRQVQVSFHPSSGGGFPAEMAHVVLLCGKCLICNRKRLGLKTYL